MCTMARRTGPERTFSEESRPVRAECTAVFERVLEDPKLKLPKDLAAELPDLLWTWHMGIVLFWVHDESEGRRRTWQLMQQSLSSNW